MNTQRFKLDKPGLIEITLPFSEKGEEKELLGIISAYEPGDYVVRVISDHQAENTYGRVVIKGVAANGARVSVDGMVKIGKFARKTDSFLDMRVLLLDKKSSAIAEPKLEIENNDVKASHAATVGKVDEEQVFYLTSRGVEKKEAEKLIVEGFLKDVAE